MKSFNVIIQNFNTNKFDPYDVMPFFIEEYNKLKKKPKTYNEFYKFIEENSKYMFWSRCQYEIIICGWPNLDTQEKWDIHKQIMMNIEVITNILIENIEK